MNVLEVIQPFLTKKPNCFPKRCENMLLPAAIFPSTINSLACTQDIFSCCFSAIDLELQVGELLLYNIWLVLDKTVPICHLKASKLLDDESALNDDPGTMISCETNCN